MRRAGGHPAGPRQAGGDRNPLKIRVKGNVGNERGWSWRGSVRPGGLAGTALRALRTGLQPGGGEKRLFPPAQCSSDCI